MAAILEELETVKNQSPPLILIHDGGGTIFQYFMLGPFDRSTYAIANPYWDDGSKPADGIHQLAQEYIDAIRATIPKGSFILGGWSFGGAVSLEIARILSNDIDLKIIGLVLIDTHCPWHESRKTLKDREPIFLDTTSAEVKAKVKHSFKNAREMMSAWIKPEAFDAPPAVLIRAADKKAPDASDDTEAQLDDDILGWSALECLQIKSVVDVPGDHFSMFEESRLDNLTQKINEACSSFE